jgi:hypothetical protein
VSEALDEEPRKALTETGDQATSSAGADPGREGRSPTSTVELDVVLRELLAGRAD